MGSHDEQPPLVIRPGFSRLLAGLVLVTHLGALAVAAMLPVAWPWRLGLGVSIFLSLGYNWATHVQPLHPWALFEAVWEADGTWTLTRLSGDAVTATLLPSTFVAVGMVVLNLRCSRFRTYSLVLLRDGLDPDLLRRLRVRLRLHEADDSSGLP